MGTYVVSGVKVSQDGTGKVTSASDATLSVFFEGANSGFTFAYDGPIQSATPTPVRLTTIRTQISLHGDSLTSGFDVSLGSTVWKGKTVQLLEVHDTSNGALYYFQLQGGRASPTIVNAAEWASLLGAAPVFGASSFSPGAVIFPGQFERDSFSDNDKLSLGEGDDQVATGSGRDVIYGGYGDDTITTSSGHDSLYGGAGDDTFWLRNSIASASVTFLEGNALFGGGDSDTLAFDLTQQTAKASVTVDLKLGKAVFDGLGHVATTLQSIENLTITGAGAKLHSAVVTGSDGANVFDFGGSSFLSLKLVAGSGNDAALGLGGNCTIDGGSGNDTIQMTEGSLHAMGGSGDDVIISDGSGVAFEKGDTGNDSLQGGSAADKLIGDNGDDTLAGMDGKDSLYGGVGDDRIDGGGGQDLIYGGLGNDHILGGEGNDNLFGSDGDDTIEGVAGQDTILGGAGDDFIFGGTGNRVALYGGDGADDMTAGGTTSRPEPGIGFVPGEAVFGDKGNDTLTGNWGQDTLNGGVGYDLMQGFVLDEDGHKIGDGVRDVFVLSAPVPHGPVSLSDTVIFFEPGVDKLDLSELGIAMRLTDEPFVKDKTAKLHYDAQSGLLTADLEGKGKVGWMAEVYTIGHADLTNSDFIF